MISTLRKSKWIQREVRKLLWMKEHQPVRFKILETLTESMILGTWLVTSVGIAFLMTINGYTTFDSAMMGMAIVDFNIVFYSIIKDKK